MWIEIGLPPLLLNGAKHQKNPATLIFKVTE